MIEKKGAIPSEVVEKSSTLHTASFTPHPRGSGLSEEKQIEEMAKILCGMKNGCDGCMWDKVHCYERNDAEEIYNAGYRKQSEGGINYKALYEQLLEDFEHALHHAEKNNNVCNFCEHDCGEGGICKGRNNFIYCTPKWRGVKKIIPDCEAPKGGAE